MVKGETGINEFMTRSLFEAYYDMAKRHEIGYWELMHIYDSPIGKIYATICAYYEYNEPNVILTDDKMSFRVKVSCVDGHYVDGNKDLYEQIKDGWIKHITRWYLGILDYYIYYNPNHRKYHKIYRKYKNHWYKRLSYKSIHKETYFHWQETDRWFYSEAEIKKHIAKFGTDDLSDPVDYPNYTEVKFDHAEPTGYWG